MEESWRARPAASLLCLRIPACDAADISVQAHPGSRAYARAIKPALSHRSHRHDLGAVRTLAGAIALAGAGVTVGAAAIRRRGGFVERLSRSAERHATAFGPDAGDLR